MFRTNATTAYKMAQDVAIENADPHRLIALLFEGAIRAIQLAQIHMADKDLAKQGENISKAIDIVNNGLRAALDHDSEEPLVHNLSSLYTYMSFRLLHANMHHDNGALEEVRMLLQDLNDAWAQIRPGQLAA